MTALTTVRTRFTRLRRLYRATASTRDILQAFDAVDAALEALDTPPTAAEPRPPASVSVGGASPNSQLGPAALCCCGHKLGRHYFGHMKHCDEPGCGCTCFVAQVVAATTVAPTAPNSQLGPRLCECGHAQAFHYDGPALPPACDTHNCLCAGYRAQLAPDVQPPTPAIDARNAEQTGVAK